MWSPWLRGNLSKQQQITDTDQDLGLATRQRHIFMDLCVIGQYAVLGKTKYHYWHPTPVEIWHLELNLSPWPRSLTLTSKEVERQQIVMSKHILSQFDLDLWPTTYNPSLAKVNCDAKNQSQTFQAGENRQEMDGRTDRCYQTYYLPCFVLTKSWKKPEILVWSLEHI